MGLRVWRICWLAFLVGQGMLASAWWWLSPGGFGVGHPRFWLNRAAAPAIAAAAVATLWALRGDRSGPLRRLLPAWAAGWVGMGLALRIAFPIAMGRFWAVPVGIGAAMGLAAIRPWKSAAIDAPRLGPTAAAIAGAAMAGAMIVAALLPPPPDTHPLDPTFADETPAGPVESAVQPGSVHLDPGLMVQTSDGSILARVEPMTILIQPLLRFLSRSPDGAPVVLVPAASRAGPEPRFLGGRRTGARSCRLSYRFPGQGAASLVAAADPDCGVAAIEATSRLDRPEASHLNAFCDAEIRGHHRLALEFSPCPGAVIEVRPFGYPSGAPARFAFVSADRTFRVVEAAGGEKGPFRTLARGRLAPEDALAITLHDEGRPIARLALDDFAAQADTTPSPTAGWGVPVNAIEFSLSDDRPAAPASIFVTLAGTSVGRGWDCVWHRAGTYRNRIRIEAIDRAVRPGPSPSVQSSRPTPARSAGAEPPGRQIVAAGARVRPRSGFTSGAC